jgi:hypothetical protein
MPDRPPIVVHLERGLRRHFDDMLRQPVPPRLNELLCRLKMEEAYRSGSDKTKPAKVEGRSFDPETVALMGQVYDSTIEYLKKAGTPFDEAAKSALATRILEAISNRERDINRLAQIALEATVTARAPDLGETPQVALNASTVSAENAEHQHSASEEGYQQKDD